jgi:hypothetical protein
MKRQILLFTFLFFILGIKAQNFTRPNEWKKYKREVFVTLGTSNFLGDLGGKAKEGRDYSPADLNFNQSRVAFGFGGRYKVQRWANVVAKFSYLNVRGDDASSKEPIRFNRNLNFKSNIYEISARVEAGYQSTKRGASKYGVRKNYGRMKNITHNLYGFVGIGGFYYNPKGRRENGDWVALKPLNTEGQGLAGGAAAYSKYSISFPIGAYYKLTLNKKWSLGIEFSYRPTRTDYIDDVSTVYYDPQKLAAAYGSLSAEMSDPSLGISPYQTATAPNGDGTGAQRGDKQKDSYMSLEITASYIFKKQRKSARLRSKF